MTWTQDDLDAGVIGTSVDGGSGTATVSSGATSDTDPGGVNLAQTPGINVVKTPDIGDAGQPLTQAVSSTVVFSYTVTNTGNVSLPGVVLSDNLEGTPTFVGGDTDGDNELDIGETWTYTADHTVTQDDLDAGVIGTSVDGDSGTATVSSGATSDTDPGGVNLAQTLGINVVKTPDIGGAGQPLTQAVSSTVVFTYTVTNTGNVSLAGVVLSDNLEGTPTFVGGDTDGDNELDVGETWTYTADHIVTQDDLDAGVIGTSVDGDSGTATVSSGATSDTDPGGVTLAQTPGINVVKTPDVGDAPQPFSQTVSSTIPFTYDVTNTGNVSLASVVLSDDLEGTPTFVGGDTDGDNELDVGETWTYTANHVVTQADLDAGQIGTDGVDGNLGTATVGGSGVNGSGPASDTDPGGVTLVQTPGIAVSKSADVASVSAPGTITYSYSVTNTGNVSLTNVTLSDNNIDAGSLSFTGGDTDADTKLDVTETWTYSATHTVDQAEVDSGADIVNVATADSNEAGPVTDTVTVPVVQTPGIAVVKTADVSSVSAPGTINYSYSVTNTGNVSLTGVTLSDNNSDASPVFTGGDTDADGALDLTETWTYSATHTVDQAAIDSGGDIVNVATADSNEAGPVTDTVTVPVVQTPGIAVVKTADVSSVSAPGTINYSYSVTNTGNVSLTGVTLSDNNSDASPVFTGGDTDADGALDLTETWTYSATHTVDQAAIDSGADIVNVATADSNEAGPVTDTVTVPVVQNPGIAVVKTADVSSVSAPGTINYSYSVTNTGNVSLTNVTLSDNNSDASPVFTGGDTDADGALDLTETWTYSATHTVDQAAIDSGADIVNVATADSNEAGPVTDTVTVPVVQTPGIAVVKTADVSSVSAPGTINYSYSVTNTGNVSLTGVTLSDNNSDASPVFTGGDTDADGALDLTETWTYSATHTVDQAAIDSGADIVNVATADSTEAGPVTDTVTVPVVQNPGIAVVKTADVSSVSAPGTINYSYSVTNTGNVSLTNVTLSDNNSDASPVFTGGDTDADGALDLTETWTYSASHTVDQAAIDSGADIVNVATADSNEAGPATDTVTVTVVQTPGIAVVKTADVSSVSAPGTINYSYSVTNTGNVSLTGVTLSDNNSDASPVFTGGDTDADGALDLTETWTYSASHTVDQAAIDSGADIVNVATADSNEAGPVTDTVTVPVIQTPGIDTVKSFASNADEDGSNDVSLNDTITYSFLITNTGNVTLTNVTTTDLLPGVGPITLAATTLAPNATTTGSAAYVVTSADVTAGVINNTSTASGTAPDGSQPSDDDSVSVPVVQAVLSVSKIAALTEVFYTVSNTAFASASNAATASDTRSDTVVVTTEITYAITVTNNGDGNAVGVMLTDAVPAGTTFVTASAGCSESGGTVTCNIGGLAANGGSATVRRVRTAAASPAFESRVLPC